MWVKICANTNLEDAQLAVDLGADALGFVLAASSRQVTASQVQAIRERLRLGARPVEAVGVFQTQDAGEIVATVREAGLSGVQLHGGYNLALAREVRERLGDGVTMTQVVHWVVGEDVASAAQIGERLREMAAVGGIDRVLLDSKVGTMGGGSGQRFNWSAARTVLDEARSRDGLLKVILAGGLRPENLGEAIGEVAPWGVDVASGVEASPGLKDAARLREFIGIARGE